MKGTSPPEKLYQKAKNNLPCLPALLRHIPIPSGAGDADRCRGTLRKLINYNIQGDGSQIALINADKDKEF